MDLPCPGLSPEEVAERRRAGLSNTVSASTGKSVGKIITSNLFTYFNFVFLIISILLVSAGSPIRNFTFLPIILANSLIGIIQELRAKKVLDDLQVLNTPVARAVRAGQIAKVPITELVQDDVIFLKAGDQICADAELISGEVAVNESLLTGESDEIAKKPKSELMSGSFVVHGECFARLTRVGDAAYAAQLTLRAKAIKSEEQSKIVESLNKFVRLAGIAIVPIGVIMVVQQLVKGADYGHSIIAMVAAIIGMIPEGLFLLASVTLLLSAMRLARQQVLLHDMKSIETLARVDVLCVDKTGTITTGKMQVEDTIWLQPEAEYADPLRATIHALTADSETMVALKNAFKHAPKNHPAPTKIQGFSSKLKYSGVTFAADKSHGERSFVIGAPELVLRSDYDKYADQIESYGKQGFRVLVFAEYGGELQDQPLTKKATPLAIIIIADEIRQSASRTFAYFAEQGVAIKVISGDSPLTVSAVAARAGIENAYKYIDLSKKHYENAELAELVRSHTVFGRVTPADKRRLVQALQSAGHTVAMTGDGVNDVLALKDADCSIAMASGASAAASAAQMVLLESDFSKMPSVVLEGRRVVNNLERSGSLFIVKNLFSFSAAILAIIAGVVYPMLPAHVSLVSFWAIGAPSFLLAQIPNSALIRGDFVSNILKVAIPTAATAVLFLAIANVLCRLTGVSLEHIGTISVLIWAGVSLTHLFLIARPYSRISLMICLFCLLGVIGSFLVASPLFALERDMGLREWAIIIPLILCAYPVIMLFRYFTRKIYHAVSYRR